MTFLTPLPEGTNPRILLRYIYRRRGLWLRALVCWMVGVGFVFYSPTYYDRRFQLRGTQPHNHDIMMVHIDKNEWLALKRVSNNQRLKSDLQVVPESFYWDREIWSHMLHRLLLLEPKAIVVTFFFGPDLSMSPIISSEFANLPKVLWSARIDSEGRLILPRFANSQNRNVGLFDIRLDRDDVVRTFHSPFLELPHVAAKVTDRVVAPDENVFINYRGGAGTFPVLSLTRLLDGHFTPQQFKNKIVIIGLSGVGNTEGGYRTPVGRMSSAEILANVTDNLLESRQITNLNPWLASAFLFGLLILSVWIIFSYPQTVALVFYVWVGTTVSAVSMWTFDTFNFWTPLAAPLLQLLVTYIVFLSFQLTMKDNLNWRLAQKQKYTLQIEELKNNFVSLISHDLKTPIAKIQAIVDRVLAHNPQSEIKDDLLALRRESAELHRYIQSILHISRVESHSYKINKDAADINEIAFDVIQQIKPLAVAKGIDIKTELEPMFLIDMDSVLIQEVILNLVENAVKYSLPPATVTVSTFEDKDQAFFYVQDEGPGIPEGEKDRIFEKFYRGTGQELTSKGSGLGLYLVKYFIELHGGRVYLESEVGKGTKIGFSLPIGEESAMEHEGS